MSDLKWHFNKLLSGENPIDTVGGEFFSLEALKDEALPREFGQNSLDQVLSGKKLSLKIEIHEESKKSIADSKFLKGIYEHCSSDKSGIPRHIIPDPNKKFRYMVIEDFNTTGVIGDINFHGLIDNTNQNYFNLFRSMGMTSKDKDNTNTLGSWGMGKNMYAQVSRISTFLGYTCRKEAPQELLTGMSILKLHTVGDTDYKNTGNFGYGNSENDQLVMPVEQEDIIEEFKSEFNIIRTARNDRGLSLVIPCILDSITAEKIIQAFIKTWGLAILKDKMELHLKSDEIDVIIDKDSLLDHLNYFDENEKRKVQRSIGFLQKSIDLKDEDYFNLKFREVDRPSWNMGQLIDEEMTSEARDRLESEVAHIGFKVPLNIAYNDEDPQKGEFEVHIFRDREISNPYSIQYFRGLLLIPGVLPNKPLNKPYHSIIIVYGTLADVFAKAEGPAHYQWSDGISKFQQLNLKEGKSLLNFVRNSANRIKSHLNQSDVELDDEIAGQLLGYIVPSPGPGSSNVPVDDEVENDPPDPPTEPIPPSYSPNYSELTDGVSYRDNPDMSDDKVINKTYKLKVSYNVEEGNPHNYYTEDQFDFKKPPIRVEASGVDILISEKNNLEFMVNERDWSLKIRGFDVDAYHRELRINLS